MSDQNVAPEAEPVAPPAEAAPAAPAPPAPTSDAPWAQDLLSAFPDEAERGRVDQFMRERYQPYVTRVEQEAAPARQLYDALQGDDSLETYLGLAEQLYGEDVANLLAETIISRYAEDGPAAPEQPAAPAEPAGEPQLPEHIQQMYEEYEANKARDEYWAEMNRVKEADARVDTDLFHPFVVGAGGDFDLALQQYQQWYSKAYPEAPAEPTPEPPATLGSDHVGGPTPPVAKRYDSLDSAIDDTLAEMRASRNQPPPSVGSA